MSPQARERHIEQVTAALQREEAWASEGRPHFRAKVSAASTLSEHFERIGRHVYVACELPVLYPGESPFSPDLLAVRDVQDPLDEDTRTAWVVAEEGRGLDLGVLDGRLRFFLGEAMIPETREPLERLERLMDQRTLRILELEGQLAEESAARQAAEDRRAALEQQRDAALARAAALEAELERLRSAARPSGS